MEPKDIRDKLRKILRVSKSIKMDRLQNMLKLDNDTFNELIIDLAEEFGFRIEKEYILFEQSSTEEFAAKEARRFLELERWEEAITSLEKVKKIASELAHSERVLWAERMLLEATASKAREERAKRIVNFRDADIPQLEADALRILEKLAHQQFSLVDLVEAETEMGFSVEGNRVIGIGMDDCGIGIILESIGDFSSLERLGFPFNKLTTLPDSIGQLKSLKELLLKHNQLTFLPESICNLASL
ncbi:MAG: hypothetical protein ACTSVY_16030 [Candidatus Helarchaeota archaeon]